MKFLIFVFVVIFAKPALAECGDKGGPGYRAPLRHLLLCCMIYYNGARTHLSLEKDAPVSRAVDRAGHILCRPILGGLHHQYGRI
jgi:hypothetical protein